MCLVKNSGIYLCHSPGALGFSTRYIKRSSLRGFSKDDSFFVSKRQTWVTHKEKGGGLGWVGSSQASKLAWGILYIFIYAKNNPSHSCIEGYPAIAG